MKTLHTRSCREASIFNNQHCGLSLVEVMVAMALGLVVVLGVFSVMANNRENFRITEGLSEMQDSARTAFELIARDIRSARDTGCGPSKVITTVLPEAAPAWLAWQPLLATDGATDAVEIGDAPGQRVIDTQILQLQGTFDGWPLRNPLPSAADVTTLAEHPFTVGDLVVICNYSDTKDSRLHRVTGTVGSTVSVAPETEVFNGQIARYRAVTWFIGNNGRATEGGTSLYRVLYDGRALHPPTEPAPNPRVEEILPGITQMTLAYRVVGGGDFVSADIPAPDPNRISAIRIGLTMESTQMRGMTGDARLLGSDGRMKREFTHIIALRNIETP